MAEYETETQIKEYEKKFLEVVEIYCRDRGERVKRKFISAVVAAHLTGQDLAPILEAKGMKVLSDRLQRFQKDWVDERKGWSYSLLVSANVLNLFEAIAKKILNKG